MNQKFFNKFKNRFYEKNPNSSYVFLNESKKINHVIVMVNGIRVDCRSRGLLEGKKPMVPREHINNEIEKLNNNTFKILETTRSKLKVKDKYGICLISKKGIKKHSISVKNAIDKTTYYRNWLNDKYVDKYDLSLVEYKNSRLPIKIICKKHGTVEIIPKYLNRGRLCGLCSEENLSNNPFRHTVWLSRAMNSKWFESFKVYIIKCYNENEVFYKIGKTYLPIKYRLKGIPYKCEVIKLFEKIKLNENSSKDISNLEVRLKGIHKNLSYTPLIYFRGNTECYESILNITK